ncbi:MAG: type II secretion system F family protein [Terriglobales bacterium]
MTSLWLVLLVGAVAMAVFAAGAAWMAPGARALGRLRQALGFAAPTPKAGDRIRQALSDASRLLPASPKEVSRTRQLLLEAGYRQAQHARIYFGLRAVLVLGLLLLVLVAGWERHSPLLLVALPLLGWVLPRFGLRRLAAQRAQRIRLSLPDVLDLMVICIEAGLGLETALHRVAQELRHLHPDLCGELDLAALETRAGVPRAEALRNLAHRSGVDDLRTLAAVLIQADRFGTSVAQVLRIQSDALRVERSQRAEEAAAKLSIKMLPVLALFLFPAVMIVVLGPAVLSLIRHLGPVLKP